MFNRYFGRCIYRFIRRGTYYKLTQPVPPALAIIPLPTGTVHHAGAVESPPYNTIQGAINASTTLNGYGFFLDDAVYTITAVITVNKPITIEGQGAALTTIEKLVATAS